jgi:hypothetical protein
MCGLDHFDLVLVHEQVLMVVLECEWGSDHRHVVLVLDRDHAIVGPVVPMFGQGSGLHHGFEVPIGGKDYCHFHVHGEWLVPTRSQIHLMSALAPSSHRDFFVQRSKRSSHYPYRFRPESNCS